MSENKHYGRQILLSLFLTVFILLGLLYLASRYLLPLYSINQEQIYDVLVKLFPLLIGLVMIEIGVLVARKRDEDFADEIDKLPPNAYDKPLYTLPGDDPLHRHTDEMVHSHSIASEYHTYETPLAPEDEITLSFPPIREVDTPRPEAVTPREIESVPPPVKPLEPFAEQAVTTSLEPIVVDGRATVLATHNADFDTILDVELKNAQELDYDLTLVLVDVSKGPAKQIANKMIMLSGELAYSFTLENDRIAMVLPFYNAEEARSFTLSLLESCKKEFSGASLQIGFASRNGRILDSSLLLHEAVTACMLEDDEEESEEVLLEENKEVTLPEEEPVVDEESILDDEEVPLDEEDSEKPLPF